MRVDAARILVGMGYAVDRDFVASALDSNTVDVRWLAQTAQPTEADIEAAAPAVLAALAAAQAEAGAYQADRAELKTQYAAAATRLETIRDAASMTNAQSLAALKDLAGIQLRMLKIIRGL